MHNFETLELTLAYDTTHALNFKFNYDSVILGRLVKNGGEIQRMCDFHSWKIC